jgi:hypothetical protein
MTSPSEGKTNLIHANGEAKSDLVRTDSVQDLRGEITASQPQILRPSSSDTLGWMPRAIRILESLPDETRSRIPAQHQTVTFSRSFLNELLGGIPWSGGLHYAPHKTGTCIIKSRAWYMLNSPAEPFLPKRPGEHGAKLVAFFRYVSCYHLGSG